MLILVSDLPARLREYVPLLRECVTVALQEFVAEHAPLRYKYTARTEASIIHDYMVRHAKDRFPWKLRNNLLLIEVGQDYRIKLKKLDGRGRASSIPTQAVLDFENQQPLRLFTDLDPTYLFLGYQKADEISNSTIWLVYPDGRSTRWAADLTGADGMAALSVVPLEPTQPEAPRVRRVRRKVAREVAAN